MGLSFGHLIIVLAAVVILFGRGRISSTMGDLGKGIRAFKDGMNTPVDDKDVKQITSDNGTHKAE